MSQTSPSVSGSTPCLPLSPLPVPIRWSGEGPPVLPRAQTPYAAGLDLHAALSEATVLHPGERRLLPTNLSIALPPGTEAQIRPRSGLALKHGVTVLNAPGTIDADYRGEICVLLINLGQEDFTIHPQDRIAQMVIAPVHSVEWRLVEVLPLSVRGSEGFGSTGR